MHRMTLTGVFLLATSACGPPPHPEARHGMRDRAVLTSAEIDVSRSAEWTAYDLIAKLRPEFLRSRGPSSLREPVAPTATVYLDNVRFGNLETLKSISADQVRRVEYINAADATTRYGTDHVGGAILILTKER